MNILYLCHRFPFPPKRGGKIRPFNMIRHLSENHSVHVFSLAHSEPDASDAPGISDYCSSYHFEKPATTSRVFRMLSNVATSQPSALGYFYSAKLAEAIDNCCEKNQIDLIFVHCAFVAGYVSEKNGVKKILDFGDMDSQKWRAYSRVKRFPMSFVYGLEARKMERYEKLMAAKFDCCTATTQQELETLESMGSARDTGWFPNGVDHQFFSPGEDNITDLNTIIFVGRMDYYPNQQAVLFFADEVLPLLLEKRPDTIFKIVGAEPPTHIKELAQRASIEVTGTVDDVRAHVSQAALTVAPLSIARGTQNKILESMALGVPVVSSTLASKGVDAEAGKDLLTADTAQEYAEAVISILENPALREALSSAGRRAVLKNHDWRNSMLRMDKLIDRVMG